MSFTAEVVLWCVFVPALVAGSVAILNEVLFGRRSAGPDPGIPPSVLDSSGTAPTMRLGIGMGWFIAISVSLIMRQWLPAEAPWTETVVGLESWQTGLWGLAAMAILPATLIGLKATTSWQVGAVGIIAALLGCVILPSGENWTDVLPLHRPWFTLIVISVICNGLSLHTHAVSHAVVWSPLIMLAGLAPGFLLGALSYASPAEWTMSAIAATVGVYLASLAMAWWRPEGGWRIAPASIIWPVVGMISISVTTARFYTWEEYPAWIYGIALFLPTIVIAVDWPLRGKSWKTRIPIAAASSILLIAVSAWKLLLAEPVEQW